MAERPASPPGGGRFRCGSASVAPDGAGKAALVAAIAETMRERGLTQIEAARLCRTDQPTLSKLLRGRLRGHVSIDKLTAWLTALGRTVEIRVRPGVADAGGRLVVRGRADDASGRGPAR
jgi:predicted XRE-type DNA-binding protein